MARGWTSIMVTEELATKMKRCGWPRLLRVWRPNLITSSPHSLPTSMPHFDIIARAKEVVCQPIPTNHASSFSVSAIRTSAVEGEPIVMGEKTCGGSIEINEKDLLCTTFSSGVGVGVSAPPQGACGHTRPRIARHLVRGLGPPTPVCRLAPVLPCPFPRPRAPPALPRQCLQHH
ncbi:hypothetical protein B0H12DRAFT_1328588 [Mycena haematopus]|nr:hypothetical protein B0H12DRAFT_1328588 [Mycena haematopus]